MKYQTHHRKTLARFNALSQLKSITAALAVLAAALPLNSRADATWVGDTSQDWNDAANWDSDPAAPSGTLTINTNTPGVFPIISANSAWTTVDIYVGNGTNSTGGSLVGRVDQTGGTNATGSGNWLRIGNFGGTGTYNLLGGVLNTWAVHNCTSGLSNAPSAATINITNATLKTGAETVLADGGNNTVTAVGTLNVGSGGTLSTEGDLILCWAGTNTTIGTVNIGAGGTVNVASSTERWLIMNQWDLTQARLTVDGGTLNLNAGTDIRFSPGNGVGTSFMTLNSGKITGTAGSVLDLNRAGGVVDNTFNLNGGTLTIGQINSEGSKTGSRVFNFHGGTLKAAGSSAAFMPVGAASVADISAAGAFIDTTNFDITIGQTLSGSGGLTKMGSGALTLSGTNSYNGATLVQAGTLNLTPLGDYSAGVSFSSGTTLGAVTANGAASVSVGSLTLSGNNTVNIDFGTATTPTFLPAIAVAGALSVSGTATINVTGQYLQIGQHYLIQDYANPPSTANFQLGTLPPGVVATLDDTSVFGTLVLNITAAGQSLTWWGADSVGNLLNTWDINNNMNWDNGFSAYLQYNGNSYGDSVTFDDNVSTGTSGSTNVTLNVRVVPLSVTVNSAYAYSLTGSGGIDGSGTLEMASTGSLLLGTSNNYSGGTTIGGSATLIVPNDHALGASAGTLTMSGGTLQVNNTTTSTRPVGFSSASTIRVADGANAQFNGAFSGSGGLTKNGNGTLTLGGTYNVSGFNQVNAGRAVLAAAINANGDISVGEGTGTTGTVDVVSGGTVTMPSTWFFVGHNNGSGKLNVTGNGAMSVLRLWIGGAFYGDNGIGNANIDTSGKIWGSDGIMLGQAWNNGSAVATVNLTNGTVASGNEFWTGSTCNPGSSNNATFNQRGGTVSSSSYFDVSRGGDGGLSIGTYNLFAGTVNAATNSGLTSIGAGAPCTGILNVSGGTFNTTKNGMIVGEGWTGTGTAAGTLNLSGTGLVDVGTHGLQLGAQAIGDGTVNLNGGTLRVGSVFKGAGSGTFNFNGGTLKAGASSTTFMQGLTAANVMSGGAIIDTTNKNITITQSLLSGGGGGGLTKIGSGALYLNGTNTYSGTTMVTAGTLGGNGRFLGPVVLSSGTTLSPGTSIGTMTFSNSLTFGGNLVFEVNKSYVLTNNDKCVVLISGVTNTGSGTLTVVNQGLVAAGDTFQLFNKPVVNGNNLTITPSSPAPGYAWVNNLAVDGTISVVATSPVSYTEKLYGVTSDSRLVSFWNNTPGTIESGVDITYNGVTLPNIVGCDFVGSTLYAVTGNSLYTVDTATGVATLVGGFTPSLNYAAGCGVSAGPGGLRVVTDTEQHVLLDYSTAEATVEASLNSTNATGLAYDTGSGVTYVVDTATVGIGDDYLATLNIGSGALTEVGSGLGNDFSRRNGFAISSKSQHQAYIVSTAGSSGANANLYSVDLAAGTSGFEGPVGEGDPAIVLVGLGVGPEFNAAAANPTITATVTGGGTTLSLSWPATGWTLQAQTNSLSVGLSSNWVDVPGSSSVTSMDIPITKTDPMVLYRLTQ